MDTGRLEAFSDGVIAVVITIMVLEIKVPAGSTFTALEETTPILLVYVLSFVNVGIWWANHHHMFHATERLDGRVLWANLFLLFWISLMPFAIRWMDESKLGSLPTASYGVTLLMASVAWQLLERAIVACNGESSKVAQALGGNRREITSTLGYAISLPLAFVRPWIAIAIYVAIALMWLVPDRRIESVLKR